jgi:hypothetical protein
MLIAFLSVSNSQIETDTVVSLYRIRHSGRAFSMHCRQILKLCECEDHVSSSRLNGELEFLPAANESHSIALAATRRLRTAAAWVRLRVTLSGICSGKSGTEAGFLCVLWFSLPILIPPTVPYSLIILSSTLYSLDAESAVKYLT